MKMKLNEPRRKGETTYMYKPVGSCSISATLHLDILQALKKRDILTSLQPKENLNLCVRGTNRWGLWWNHIYIYVTLHKKTLTK